MEWTEHKARIRRYLRDPDGNIWTDAEIKRFFNIEQIEFQRDFGEVEEISIIRIPPLFQQTYLYDWEWAYSEHSEGYINTCISDKNYYDQADMVFTQRWEPEHIAGSTSSVTDLGTFFIHPWEAWMVETTPADSPPIWIANKFYKLLFIAYNKELLEPQTEKEIMVKDRTWRTRAGVPVYYWRSETLENFIHVFPLPSSVTWDDPTDESMVISDMDDSILGDEEATNSDLTDGDDWYATGGITLTNNTAVFACSSLSLLYQLNGLSENTKYYFEIEVDAYASGTLQIDYDFPLQSENLSITTTGTYEHVITMLTKDDIALRTTDFNGTISSISAKAMSSDGTVIDYTGAFSNENDGITLDLLSQDDNLLVAYQKVPVDMNNATDISDFPSFLTKYIEYGTLERLYSADTDGKIDSLKDYWAYRKEVARNVVRLYKSKKGVDRDYCLKTKGLPPQRKLRHARLPDAYPAI